MNNKFKLVRLVFAAMVGSLLWAGCASERTYYGDSSSSVRPVDLMANRANTHPEWRRGWNKISQELDEPLVIVEVAGRERPR